jgi:hypothetical protein
MKQLKGLRMANEVSMADARKMKMDQLVHITALLNDRA